MATATITGPVYGVSQTFDFISMSIVFELSHWDSIDDVGLIASGPIIVPVDENGDFSVDLVLNTGGSQVTNYQCFLQYRRTDGTEWIREPIGVFSLSAVGTYQLSDLSIISVEGVESSLDVYTQITSVLETVNTAITTVSDLKTDTETAATNAATVLTNVQNISDSLIKYQNNWVTAASYKVGDIVAFTEVLYICLVDHTSNVFVTDLDANNWAPFAALPDLDSDPNEGLNFLNKNNNLSDIADLPTTLNNLTVRPKTDFVGLGFFTFDVSPRSGMIFLQGADLLRDSYPLLFAQWGTTYGVGDGSTTFGTPDMRAEFLRGLDAGRGVDVGRVLGSGQLDALQGHNHQYNAGANGNNSLDIRFSYTDTSDNTVLVDKGFTGVLTDDGTNGTPRVASETRSRNIAVNFAVFYE
jgi:microcystin-dependent protein